MHATVILQDDASATSFAAPRPFITRSLILTYAASMIVAVLIAAASAVGLAYGSPGLYGSDPAAALGVTPSVAGVLVPGFLAHDAFNLLLALPMLLVVLWLARRGSLLALLPVGPCSTCCTRTRSIWSVPRSVRCSWPMWPLSR